jgi:hypothetical protein
MQNYNAVSAWFFICTVFVVYKLDFTERSFYAPYFYFLSSEKIRLGVEVHETAFIP